MAKCLSVFIATRLLFVFSFVIVAGLALYPNLKLPEFTPSGEHSDFAYHTIAFLLLTVSATITIGRHVLVVTSMAVFAIMLELLQTFVPGRGVFIIDAAASLLGVLLGVLVVLLVMQLWRRRFDVRWRRSP